MKSKILPLLLIFLIWAPALAQCPTPKQMHDQLGERHSLQVRSQVETIRMLLLDNLIFLGDGHLWARCAFTTTSYEAEVFPLAKKQFEDAGWITSIYYNDNKTIFEISEGYFSK